MTVLDNVMSGPVVVKGLSRESARPAALALLDRVGLAAKAGDPSASLSGGQKQRVALALAMDPDMTLFDEATSALDPELVGKVPGAIRGLARDGMAMVLVPHEMAFARDAADRLAFLRDGVVAEEGAARQVIDDPREAATRSFLGHFRGTRSGS